jgi:hypothetical protein
MLISSSRYALFPEWSSSVIILVNINSNTFRNTFGFYLKKYEEEITVHNTVR